MHTTDVSPIATTQTSAAYIRLQPQKPWSPSGPTVPISNACHSGVPRGSHIQLQQRNVQQATNTLSAIALLQRNFPQTEKMQTCQCRAWPRAATPPTRGLTLLTLVYNATLAELRCARGRRAANDRSASRRSSGEPARMSDMQVQVRLVTAGLTLRLLACAI